VWHVVGTEMSLELIPHSRCAVHLPPICRCSKKLVCCKNNLLAVCALGNHEFLLNSHEPILDFHGIHNRRESGGVSSQELNQTRMMRWWRWGCLLQMSLLVGMHVVEGLQYNLHQLVLSGNQLLEVAWGCCCWWCCWAGHCTSCSLCSPSSRLIRHKYKILWNPNYMQ
jgi:hypothetical protein